MDIFKPCANLCDDNPLIGLSRVTLKEIEITCTANAAACDAWIDTHIFKTGLDLDLSLFLSVCVCVCLSYLEI